MDLSIYILEAKYSKKPGVLSTQRSARTTTLRPDGNKAASLKAYERFRSKADFRTGLYKILTLAHQCNAGVQMLVISAHGMSLTGTVLETDEVGSINFAANEIADFFTVLPPNLLIWISACWGGYPALVQRMRPDDNTLIVIGPLTRIQGVHANIFQNTLISILSSTGLDENRLVDATKKFNNKYRESYFGDAIRFIGRSGKSVPAIGTCALAALVEKRKRTFKVVAVQRARRGDPVHIVLEDKSGKWLTSSAPFFKGSSRLGKRVSFPWVYLGKSVSLRYQIISSPDRIGLGRLNIISNVNFIRPNSSASSPVYSHCSELPKSFRKKPYKFRSHTDCPCYACNWAELVLCEGDVSFVSVECYRESCFEHDKRKEA